MSERPKETVLKTVEGQPSASSNLALSASKEGSGILPEPSFGLIGTFVVLMIEVWPCTSRRVGMSFSRVENDALPVAGWMVRERHPAKRGNARHAGVR